MEKAFTQNLDWIEEPADYFRGLGRWPTLPTPTDILLFVRRSKKTLQQEALQNRSHHRFVLVFNLQTAGVVHVDRMSLPIGPRQVLLILPYQFHHFSHLESTGLQWLFCTFELKEGTFLEPLRNRVLDAGRRIVEAREAVVADWRRCRQDERRGEYLEPVVQNAVLRLLLEMSHTLQASAADIPPEPADNLLRTMNRLMAESRGKQVAVGDLADRLQISESRLRTRFKEAAGIPLGAYLQNYRLNRAMALLRTTDQPIADIAEECGFGSPQAFSRTFKRETGLSPRAYRAPVARW